MRDSTGGPNSSRNSWQLSSFVVVSRLQINVNDGQSEDEPSLSGALSRQFRSFAVAAGGRSRSSSTSRRSPKKIRNLGSWRFPRPRRNGLAVEDDQVAFRYELRKTD